MNKQSNEIFERAKRRIPGGVNSPVRAFGAVGGAPVIAASASGAYITDVEGRRYIDYMGAWGPMLLGHGDTDVVAAVQAAATRGFSYGLATEQEAELAELLCELFPSMQKVRLVNSGTEATMAAVRLARGHTGRSLVVKFEGCYHGHADFLLVQVGSGVATFSTETKSAPSSDGVLRETAETTLVLPFNDTAAIDACFQKHGNQIAAVILEPVVGNMGTVPPAENFLPALRSVCDKYGALLIFDEVMTGMRVARGGAQERYKIRPDLTTLGKIVGGGLPIGAYGGPAAIMDKVSPLGKVYQAGTLSGNPLTVAAGLATIRKILAWRDPASGRGAYEQLEMLGARLESALAPVLQKSTSPVCMQRVGSMFTLFFSAGPVRDWSDSSRGDHSANGPFAKFFRALLADGILFPPSSYEAAFISLAHTPELIDKTAASMARALSV